MIIHIITSHLRVLLYDIETCYADGSLKIQPSSKALYEAAIIAFHETILACESYFATQDIHRLHQDIIMTGMNFTMRWEIWIGTLGPCSLKSAASKTFHEYLLRFSKGALKAWRIWKIDAAK